MGSSIFQLEEQLKETVLGPLSLDTPIYRIFARDIFQKLLASGKNALARPKKWDDPFENCFLKCWTETDEGEEISMERIRDKWYGQCWTTEADTDAMWRIYSHEKNSIRVRSTPRKLLMSLRSVFPASERNLRCILGKVDYKSTAEIDEWLDNGIVINMLGHQNSTAKTLLVKREEFSHENEVRILFQDYDSENKEDLYFYPFDFNAVIDEVAIDPRSEPEELAKVGALLKSFKKTVPIVKSTLYDDFKPRKIRFHQ